MLKLEFDADIIHHSLYLFERGKQFMNKANFTVGLSHTLGSSDAEEN